MYLAPRPKKEGVGGWRVGGRKGCGQAGGPSAALGLFLSTARLSREFTFGPK